MSQMRHILRGLGRIIFLSEKGKKVYSGFLGEQIPAGHTLHRRGGCSLGFGEPGAAHLGHVLCKHPLVLCSTISLLGKWFVSFSFFLFISILKHLHFLREKKQGSSCLFLWMG